MTRKQREATARLRAAEADYYHLRWVACLELIPNGSFYAVDEQALEALPASGAGVYLFCRRHGRTLTPQYVGRSRCLRRRIRDHLERVSLMQALSSGERGSRVVLVAMVEPRRGQSATRVAMEVEGLLIQRFRAEAFDLVNEKGNRRPRKYVLWHGGKAYRDLIPPQIQLLSVALLTLWECAHSLPPLFLP